MFEQQDLIDVFGELEKIKTNCCPACAEKVNGLLDRWNAQKARIQTSVSASFVSAYIASHEELRNELSGPNKEEAWKRIVVELYQSVTEARR